MMMIIIINALIAIGIGIFSKSNYNAVVEFPAL